MTPRTFAVLLAAVALIGLLTYGLVKKGGSAIEIGEPVAEASTPLPRLDGDGTGSIADYRGRWVLVNVWASWCDPCRTESPALERFYEEHRGRDFTIVGIDVHDVSHDGRAFVQEFGITYPQLHDGNGEFAEDQLGTTGVPESFLLDPRGEVALHSLGPVSERYLNANVLPLLTGKAEQ